MTQVLIVAKDGLKLSEVVEGELQKRSFVVATTTGFDEQTVNADVIAWLAAGKAVDDEVFDLIDQIDRRNVAPNKIVMLSLAGINEEVGSEKLATWYGGDVTSLILAYQYAVKMIDELEIPYTIVRTAPVVNRETALTITNEGQLLAGNEIGINQLGQVIADACGPEHYDNQSIGVSDQ